MKIEHYLHLSKAQARNLVLLTGKTLAWGKALDLAEDLALTPTLCPDSEALGKSLLCTGLAMPLAEGFVKAELVGMPSKGSC